MKHPRRLGAVAYAAFYAAVPVALLAFAGPPRLPNFAGYNLFSTYLPPDQIIVTIALAFWIFWAATLSAQTARLCAFVARRAHREPVRDRDNQVALVDRSVRRTYRDVVIPLAKIPELTTSATPVELEPVAPNLGDEPVGFDMRNAEESVVDGVQSTVSLSQDGVALVEDRVVHDAVNDPMARVRTEVALRETSRNPMVRCLGPLVVERNSRLVAKGWRSRAKEILAYLCAHPQGGSKEQLIEWLWPESEVPESEFKRLTYKIRAQVRLRHEDPEIQRYVIRVGDVYRLDPNAWWVDAWEFTRLLTHARILSPEERAPSLSGALDLYRGDFCSDCYYSWAEPVREHFRQMFLHASIDLAELYRKDRRNDDALAVLDRATQVEPFNEDVCRRAMAIEEETGRPEDALRRFRTLRATLGVDVGVEPSPATIAVVERIQNSIT